MRFKTDNYFDRFIGTIPGEHCRAKAASELPAKFEQADIIGFPFPMDEALYEMPVSDIIQILSDFFGVPVGEAAVAALRDCTIIGDGNCPYCGSELEWWANDNDEDDGHRFQIYKCPDCGYEETVEID